MNNSFSELYRFPVSEFPENEDLVYCGGDLSPERILSAYRMGCYPCYPQSQPCLWWSPLSRCILPLENVRINRTLRKVMQRGGYHVTVNRDFEGVLHGCSSGPRRVGAAWLHDDMKAAYRSLHDMGVCHSLEVYRNGNLEGGLYGVALKGSGAFFGESIFGGYNAAKIALVQLVERLRNHGFLLLDCQVLTGLTACMGAIEVSRRSYLKLLAEALAASADFGGEA